MLLDVSFLIHTRELRKGPWLIVVLMVRAMREGGGAEKMPLLPSAKVNLDIPWILNEPSGHVLSTWTTDEH